MPNSVATMELVAKHAGLKFFTVERTARALREARREFWVSGGRGGGKNVARVSPAHFSNLLRGLAGHLPSDAPAALERLQWLSVSCRLLPPPNRYDAFEKTFGLLDGSDGETFEMWLERCIMNIVAFTQDGRRELLNDGDVWDGKMQLAPYDQRILITWGGEEYSGCRRILMFGEMMPLHRIVDRPRPQRITVLPLTMIVEFAQLLAAPSPPRASHLRRQMARDTTTRTGSEAPSLHHKGPAPTTRPASRSERATR